MIMGLFNKSKTKQEVIDIIESSFTLKKERKDNHTEFYWYAKSITESSFISIIIIYVILKGSRKKTKIYTATKYGLPRVELSHKEIVKLKNQLS